MSGNATTIAELELDDTNALEVLDERLFLVGDDGEVYGEWATRLGAHTDGAGATIREAIAVSGVDDPSFYRLPNLLRETQFAAAD